MQTIEQQTFCGREFTGEEILLIQEVVDTCGGISRRELAHTVLVSPKFFENLKRLRDI